MQQPAEFEDCASRLKSLADPQRLRIVQCLFAGEKNVGQIVLEVEEPIVKVSHHLKVLRKAGVVKCLKQGRFVVYRLHPDITIGAGDSQRIDFGCCSVDLNYRSQTTLAPNSGQQVATPGA